ncbi:MAG: hypothetical protein OEW75_00220 [Cyclobacteriaceae bacterium]|nr:hypothetical protein [Cyclobacteriaceae bacterium]
MKIKLDDIKSREYFTVPEGYFEKLPLKIQKQVESPRSSTSVYLPVLKWAAVFVVVVVSFFLIMNRDSVQNNPQISLNQFNDSELIDFMLDNGVTAAEILDASITSELIYNTLPEEEYLIENELLDDLVWDEVIESEIDYENI